MPFARSLRHILRIFCRAHNALQVAPAGGPHNETLVTSLERATKLLHITPALLQSSDGRCSRQGCDNEYTRGELTGLINPQSAAGPSGLRHSHLHAALCDELVEDLAAFAPFVFSSRVLPQVFRTLHTSANLSALGQKARPVACGDVLRRVIDVVFCRRYGRKLADYFQSWGQYGVAVSGGVEIMALTATLGFEEGCAIPSYDGANAFNSIYRHRFLPALAEIVPSVVPYPSNLYAREPPKLLFALGGGGLEVVESARGVQQACNLGPLCYSAGSLKILEEFRANPPVPGARVVSFIDDITRSFYRRNFLSIWQLQGKLRNGCRNVWG